jgi:hypothetical protein
VALAFQGLGVLVLAQDIFIDLHIDAAEVFKPRFNLFRTLHYFGGQIIDVDVDADRADDSEFLPYNRYGRALKFTRTNVELVVQFIFVEQLPLLQIDQQIGRAVA